MDPSWTCLFVFLAATGVLIQPMLRFVMVGWAAKRKEILDALTPNACRIYFEMFSGCGRVPPLEKAAIEFARLYDRWYGRRYFIIPGILLLLSGATAIAAVVYTVLGKPQGSPNPLFNLPQPAIAALAGAYLWVLNDQIGRARRLDFSPSDVMWGVLRIVTAVPMGYAFASVVKDDVAPFIAFAIGAFPVSTLISILRRLVLKRLEIQSADDTAGDDVIKLRGINKEIVERLSFEDVTTITQVSYCDPVRLTMRSNLSFNFVIDCMNQALAWMYLEDSLNTIRPLGLGGAVEIRQLMTDLSDPRTDPAAQRDHDKAVVLLPKIATALNQAPETLEFAFRQIADDPYTSFLAQIWGLPKPAADASDKAPIAQAKELRSVA